jgi:hypothetical protein
MPLARQQVGCNHVFICTQNLPSNIKPPSPKVKESDIEDLHKDEIAEGATLNIWSGKWQGGKRDPHPVR